MAEPKSLFTWRESAECRITVEVAPRSPRPVSRLLYGKFAEHLGRNIYNGMWAQVLRNPGFESWRYFAQSKAQLPNVYQHLLGFPASVLAAGEVDRVAPWWAPCGQGEAFYTLDRDARNSELSQRLEVTAVRSGGLGIQQPIFLPTHRTREYQLSLWVRGGEGAELRAAVVTETGEEVGTVSIPAGAAHWQRREVTLTLADKPLDRGQPLLFQLLINAPTTVWLDQVFLFPADHVSGFDPDIVRYYKEAKLPLLRWPGGNFVSGYHWKDGLGPVDQRPIRLNRAWNTAEYNHVGTDEFMAFCRAVGCEPLICLNAGDGTPEEAAQWVEYCNGGPDTEYGALRAANGHPEPYNVRYWEVGNELYGKWQIGHCSAEEYAQRYRAFHAAMTAVDSSIQLIANGNDPQWNATLLEADKDLLRSLSLHTLIGAPSRNETDAERVYRALMAYPVHYADYLQRLAGQMSQAGLEPHLALTELQIFTNKPALPNNQNLTEALWTACLLNTCARTEGMVELITHSATVNHAGGLRKVREIVYPNPVHWCHYLYSTQPHDRLAPVTVACPGYDSPGSPGIPAVKGVPYLDCLALTDETGAELSLFLVNRHPAESLPVTIRVADRSLSGSAKRLLLTAPSFLAENGWRAPDRVSLQESTVPVANGSLTIACPPHSLSRVDLQAQ